MKTHILKIVVLLLAASAIFTAQAETAEEADTGPSYRLQHRQDMLKTVRVIGASTAGRDSVDLLLRQFYMDQFRHFQDPEAPSFMFMSRDATLALGMGAQVQVKG